MTCIPYVDSWCSSWSHHGVGLPCSSLAIGNDTHIVSINTGGDDRLGVLKHLGIKSEVIYLLVFVLLSYNGNILRISCIANFWGWKFSRTSLVRERPQKTSPAKFQVHNRCKVWLEARPQKFYLQNLFLSRILQNHKIFNSQNFRLCGVLHNNMELQSKVVQALLIHPTLVITKSRLGQECWTPI